MHRFIKPKLNKYKLNRTEIILFRTRKELSVAMVSASERPGTLVRSIEDKNNFSSVVRSNVMRFFERTNQKLFLSSNERTKPTNTTYRTSALCERCVAVSYMFPNLSYYSYFSYYYVNTHQ